MSGLLFLLGCLALASAGEAPLDTLPNDYDPHHHVTTVCIQVHGSSALCGPMVKPEAARAANLQMAPSLPANHQMAPSRSAAPAFQLRDAQTNGPPADAVLQGFYEDVPVYRMRSADEMQKSKSGPPCPEPNSRSAGSITVVQPPSPYGIHQPLVGLSGLGGLGGGGLGSSVAVVQQPSGYFRAAQPPPAARTIPFAPFGVEQQKQQQQMRASQYAAMRAANANADCDDSPQFQPQLQSPMRASSSFQGQQVQQVYPNMRQAQQQAAYASMRASEQDYLAKQCAEQEAQLKKKNEEIDELKKQVDRLSSMSERTTIEQKTVSVKSASHADSQKDVSDDAKKDPQLIKKKK